METTPKNFAQIDSEWILKVERGINLKPGAGIKIDPDGDGFKISIDQEAFKQWVWSAVKHGIVYATPPLGLVPLSSLGNISLDPGV